MPEDQTGHAPEDVQNELDYTQETTSSSDEVNNGLADNTAQIGHQPTAEEIQWADEMLSTKERLSSGMREQLIEMGKEEYAQRSIRLAEAFAEVIPKVIGNAGRIRGSRAERDYHLYSNKKALEEQNRQHDEFRRMVNDLKDFVPSTTGEAEVFRFNSLIPLQPDCPVSLLSQDGTYYPVPRDLYTVIIQYINGRADNVDDSEMRDLRDRNPELSKTLRLILYKQYDSQGVYER